MIFRLLQITDALRHSARRRTWGAAPALGRRGEDLAHRYLQKRGFRIVARNFRRRSGAGEADLVAWDKATLVFVEVKSRATGEFGSPDRAVDAGKREALIRTAREYARRADVDWQQVRFDVVNVVFSEPPAVTHVADSFRPARAL